MLTLGLADGRPLANVSVARSFWARFRGLMLRPALRPGEGLYIPGTSSIHMLFMRAPIDCLFLGRPGSGGERKVVAIRHRLPPWRGVVWFVRHAEGVVELPVGTLGASGVAVGDLVRLEAAEPT
ncbi:DUF192 domain-containing protein [soil metagenome]